MKWIELKAKLDNEFPPEAAEYEWDCIGEQVTIKEEISRVMVTLDITIDVIAQAQSNNIDLIISHHPLVFGEREEVLENDKLTNAKVQLLENSNIGVYVIHTNADFNPNSIAYMQGLALGFESIEQGNENRYVIGKLKDEMIASEFIDFLKGVLELRDVEFRSNFRLEEGVKRFLIASGAGGSSIEYNNPDMINIIGEVKHHEWVKANETGAKILEISHYSEKIFKNIVQVLLHDEEIEVKLSEEKNGYKIY